MYPFERYMKTLKDYVRNPARPEGCIAESYLADECIRGGSIFRPAFGGRHSEKFAEWIKNKIPIDSKNHSDRLKWIAYGPRNKALSLTGYIVNGQRASAKDNAQVADLVTYYGILTDIILLDYHVFYVPVFKCHWANKGNGVKIEDGFTLVNLHQSQVSFARDPYILASQAKQVFYSREDDSSNWYVVLKAPPRGFHELETYDGNIDATSMPPENDMDMDDASEEVRYVREDCEGIFV
ncbi:hypothetical protein M0R45_002304 [Rubus argutus]|uniref:DUF4216 domain-containing protein n=1 Tax=Rubus argutus TaxID=59490 RepID=A0AAW1VDB5_RUBAR